MDEDTWMDDFIFNALGVKRDSITPEKAEELKVSILKLARHINCNYRLKGHRAKHLP